MSKKRAKRYARLKISTQLGLTSGHIFLKFAKSRSKLSEPARDLLHIHNLANKPRASGDSAIMASLIDIFLKFAKSRSKLSEPARDLLHIHNLANKPRASGDSAIMASLIDVGVLPIWLDEGS